jgi:SEC-C motif domain protein
MSQNEKQCLCQSRKKYKDCCQPFLEGVSAAATPEELMRSRYVAYNIGRFDYIGSTNYGEALLLFNAKDDDERVTLDGVRLDILNTSGNGESGEVEFKAYYQKSGRITYMHELSEFKKINGKWFYTKGTFLE